MVFSYVEPGKGDRGAWFRMQEIRTLEDYDELCQRKEQLRAAIG